MADTANHSAKVHKKRLKKYDRQKKADRGLKSCTSPTKRIILQRYINALEG